MDEDGMNFGETNRKGARKGRRAQAEAAEPANEPDPAPEEELPASEPAPSMDSSDAPPRPSRRVGGWGEDSGKSESRRRGDDDFVDERLKMQDSDREDSDNEPDIPVIPDLEDQQEDDMTAQMAVAPNVAVNRVATYRELDHDLLKHAAFLTLDNEIDLKLLTRGLSSEADIFEEDKAWTWDHLFTEVTSELLAEQADDMGEEEKEKVGA